MITERLYKDGMDTLAYYQSTEYNPYASSKTYKLPNCTTYACGRVQEEAQKQFKNEIPQANAKNWWAYSTWQHQSEPVPSGIICFTDKNYGHVGVCERVISTNKDGSWTILMTDSALDSDKSITNKNYYRLRTLTIKVGENPSGCAYQYQGCLVNPHSIDKRVARDETLEQFEVYKERLRVRNKPSMSEGVNYGQFAPVGIYNILEKVVEGSTTWVKLDDNQWCSVASGYARLLPITDYKVLYEKMLKENKALKEKVVSLETQVNSLSVENKALENKLVQIDKIIHN